MLRNVWKKKFSFFKKNSRYKQVSGPGQLIFCANWRRCLNLSHIHRGDKSACDTGLENTFQHIYSKTNEIHQFLTFILFWSHTLHVSDGLPVQHQDSKTVHTASGKCQTDFSDCMLARSQKTPDDGQKDRTKHKECYSKINLRNRCISLVLL